MHGEDHADVADSYYNISIVLLKQGQHAEGVKMREKSETIKIKLFREGLVGRDENENI